MATHHIRDEERGLDLTYEIWRPSGGGMHPLVLWSHFSGGGRLSASYLCEHLAAHGYIVASMDHSESALPLPSAATAAGERTERMRRYIGARVPDLRFLLDVLLAQTEIESLHIERERVGAAGHSFGGWAALAAADADPRIRSVVALAPAGSSNPRPGIIPAPLTFERRREVPALIVAGEADVSMQAAGIWEIFGRVPGTRKDLVVLGGVDHMHFVDDAANAHERVRAMNFPAELAYLKAEMRPFSELRNERETHNIVKRLTLAHFEATLRF